tara:strand:- start:16451 stop:16990 length:540 start_codon:yes stop_codon:yes gene_type:complete
MNKNVSFLILLIYFCSFINTEFILSEESLGANINSNQWLTYKKPKTNKKLFASIKSIQIVEELIKNNFPYEVRSDSIEIRTKTGKKYVGTVVDSDRDGYFIKIFNERVIFINKIEIEIIHKIEDFDKDNLAKETDLNFQNQQSFYTESTTNESKKKQINLEPIISAIGGVWLIISIFFT